MDLSQTYIASLQRALVRMDATEHTHRPALKEFVEGVLQGVVATNEPRRIEAGAPDFVISKGETPIGYIEAKDVGRDLDAVQPTDQLQRYLASLGNLILTDYLEFRWFVDGEERGRASLGHWNGRRIVPAEGEPDAVLMLLRGFASTTAATIRSPEALAKKMAALAQQIRFTILEAFRAEDLGDDQPDPLHEQYDAFKEVLLRDLDPGNFADMYAQTITYGLFAARSAPGFEPPFTRYRAAYLIPKTNPFLRTLFAQMAGPDLDNRADWIVDDLVSLLAHADIKTILEDFGSRTRQEDPVVHFYETFLKAYDPQLRETRGVYYTPEPVVSYIVRSVDSVLKRHFGVVDGLADTSKVRIANPERATSKDRKTKDVHRVQILDPATGTGTFLHAVIDQIHAAVVGSGTNHGLWSGYVKEHLLPRLHGFELLMAPYTVAHMKLGLQLAELGYGFDSDERLRVFLTNTLEEAHDFPSLPLFGQYLARETQQAGEIKSDVPVMVVIGNPPYSGHSANDGEWISEQIDTYRHIGDKRLKLRQGKWLQNDYVKFIRFAQWRLNLTGQGVLAFVTDNSYLVGETFVGMRKSLLESFDRLYVLDLHGNSLKKETAPDGSTDMNVFDIRQGVAVLIAEKLSAQKEVDGHGRVFHLNRWGSRDEKYEWLASNEALEIENWEEWIPEAPLYLFKPFDDDLRSEYQSGMSLAEIAADETSLAPGIITTHDEFAISFSKQEQIGKLETLLATESESEARSHFRLCSQDQWNYEVAKAQLSKGGWREALTPVSYRPFDVRWTVFNPNVAVHRRERASRHFVGKDNLGLITNRKANKQFQHVYCTRQIIDSSTLSTATRERSYLFPLYLYPSTEHLFEQSTENPGGRRANVSVNAIAGLSERLGLVYVRDGSGDLIETFGPEDVFHYIYAVLHSPTYRARYAEFLKLDFPRIPFTSVPDLFQALVEKGNVLVALHLLERVGSVVTGYPIEGDDTVGKIHFIAEEGTRAGRVYINDTQYFRDVPQEAWGFEIGGYQVLHKWLKDRKGRQLNYEDLRHWQHMASVLLETSGEMREIDATIEKFGGYPIS